MFASFLIKKYHRVKLWYVLYMYVYIQGSNIENHILTVYYFFY